MLYSRGFASVTTFLRGMRQKCGLKDMLGCDLKVRINYIMLVKERKRQKNTEQLKWNLV